MELSKNLTLAEGASVMTPPSISSKSINRAARKALAFSRKVLSGSISEPSKEQVTLATELIRAYASIYGKVNSPAPKKTGTIKIRNAIINPGTGVREQAGGPGLATNAMASGTNRPRATVEASAADIRERMG